MKRKQTEPEYIKDLQDEKETLQLDIDQLLEDFESKLVMISDMNNALEMLEKESRKATIRIFGLTQHISITSVGEERANSSAVVYL